MANDELEAMVRDDEFVSDCHTGTLVAPGTCPNI
jgi:hypothetical protein